MNRMIIQVDADRVAYDGRDWTPVSGESAWVIARMMKSKERLYKRQASAHPDFAYNVARAAAEDFHGRIVEYQPIPPAKPASFTKRDILLSLQLRADRSLQHWKIPHKEKR